MQHKCGAQFTTLLNVEEAIVGYLPIISAVATYADGTTFEVYYSSCAECYEVAFLAEVNSLLETLAKDELPSVGYIAMSNLRQDVKLRHTCGAKFNTQPIMAHRDIVIGLILRHGDVETLRIVNDISATSDMDLGEDLDFISLIENTLCKMAKADLPAGPHIAASSLL